MASIIIDEIVPTKWRLRLRDPEGKTREVEVRAGTPVQLDVEESEAGKKTAKQRDASSPRDKREEPRVDADDRSRTKAADKSRTDEKPRPADRSRTVEKPRTDTSDKSRTTGKTQTSAKAGRTAKAVDETPEPEPPPQIRRRKPEPGPGPGDLVWEAIEDDGVPGIRASFERGAFKILHAGGDAHGLFYEWNSGKYQTLQCGPLEALKQAAARWTADGQLRAPRSNLGAEAAKLACATGETAAANEDGPATPPVPAKPPTPATSPAASTPSAPSTPPVDPEKDKVLMDGFESTVQKLIAARKGAT
jgi:hypothetical protein